MMKKLLSLIVLLSIGASVQAATVEHVANAKAFQDQHGQQFHPELHKHVNDGKGVPHEWPGRGHNLHQKAN